MEVGEVRELFHYNPETGLLRWRINISAHIAGSPAGTRSSNGRYITVRYKGRYYMAHRIAFAWVTGRWPDPAIDHVNGDKLDNRWDNLREATWSQNAQNRRIARTNVLGYKGVIKRKGKDYRHAPYESYIRPPGGPRKYLGRFKTAQEAHAAYVKASAELHGEFART